MLQWLSKCMSLVFIFTIDSRDIWMQEKLKVSYISLERPYAISQKLIARKNFLFYSVMYVTCYFLPWQTALIRDHPPQPFGGEDIIPKVRVLCYLPLTTYCSYGIGFTMTITWRWHICWSFFYGDGLYPQGILHYSPHDMFLRGPTEEDGFYSSSGGWSLILPVFVVVTQGDERVAITLYTKMTVGEITIMRGWDHMPTPSILCLLGRWGWGCNGVAVWWCRFIHPLSCTESPEQLCPQHTLLFLHLEKENKYTQEKHLSSHLSGPFNHDKKVNLGIDL